MHPGVMDHPTSRASPVRCAAWPPPSLTTERAEAVVAYQDGVAALVARAAHADGLLRDRWRADPPSPSPASPSRWRRRPTVRPSCRPSSARG